MKEANFSDVRRKFKEILDEVVKDKKPIKIKRRDHASVILLGEEQYNELKNKTKRVKNVQKSDEAR